VLGTYIDARNYAIDPTGATDSAPGGNQALQDAITQKKKLIWPSGVFKLNSPLLAFDSDFSSVQMYGQGGAAAGTTIVPEPTSSANTTFYTNYTNAPAIILNNCRDSLLKDFAVLGQNTAPNTAAVLPTGPAASQASYITTGCQNGRYAPYCGIAFDPFSNSTGYGISGISRSSSAVVTLSTGAAANPFTFSQQIVFSNVAGMTQINGLTGTVTAVGGAPGVWTATVNINSSGFGAYTSGGTAVGLPYNIGMISSIVAGSSTLVVFSGGPLVNPAWNRESLPE
jgi:hypothetical protein